MPSDLAQGAVTFTMSTHSWFIFNLASTITSVSFPKGPQVLYQAACCSSMLSLQILSYIIQNRSEEWQVGDWTEKPLTQEDIASALSPWRHEDFALQNSPAGLRIHCLWDGSRGWGLQSWAPIGRDMWWCYQMAAKTGRSNTTLQTVWKLQEISGKASQRKSHSAP